VSSSELAALADTFDANYSSDGKYRGGAVLNHRKDGARGSMVRPKFKPPQVHTLFTPGMECGVCNGMLPKVTSDNFNSDPNQNRSNVKQQRKCWICSSPSQLQSNCPEKHRTGGSVGKQSAQTMNHAHTVV